MAKTAVKAAVDHQHDFTTGKCPCGQRGPKPGCMACLELARYEHDRDICAEYKRMVTWNKKMRALLAKEPKPMTGFTFVPNGEVE